MNAYARLFVGYNLIWIASVVGYLAVNRWELEKTSCFLLGILYLFGLLFVALSWFQNSNMLTGKKFMPLQSYGFVIETNGQYRGYKGIYRNYFVRIFYEAMSGNKGMGEVWIVLYYQSPAQLSVKEKLVSKYTNTGFSKLFSFETCQIEIRDIDITCIAPFRQWNTFSRVKDKLDFIVDLAESEGLLSLKESQVDSLIQANPNFAPLGHSKDFG